MDKETPEYLSAEELRNRLYHSLRDRGMLDNIKSQLRNNIVTELQQTTRGQLSVRDLKVPEEGSLLHRASNSLVADHLRRCKYEYALSVFLPESGIGRDKVFSTHDLLQLLSISPQSRLYRKMISGQTDLEKKGFLWQLLFEVSSLHANSVQDCGVQTDLIKVGPISSLDEKLGGVDEFYSSKKDEQFKFGATAVEDRLLSFQRQLEERYRSDLKMEVARMRDNDMARIRLEEKENCRREMDQKRRELEQVYQSKMDALIQRERNSIERMQREQEMHEKEIYTQRQTILEEIELIRRRETDVKREAEINDREKKLQAERIKAKEDDLRNRDQSVKRMEVEYEQKLSDEMTKFKVEQQAKFMERTQNLEVREARVKDEERRVSDEKEHIHSIKDQLKDKTARVNELETIIQEEKHREVSVSRQNEHLNSKLRDMADYKMLKEENVVMKNEVETLRTRLAELLSINERERGRQEEMMRDLRRPTPETLMYQRDLEKARESLRQEQTLSSAHRQTLEQRLQDELDRNRDLLRRFEEQTFQMKEMNREIVDLRGQLNITHKALSNEVFRKPREDGNRSVSFQAPRQPAESESDIDNVEFRKLPGQEFSKSRSPRRSHKPRFEDNDVYNDVDIEFGVPSSGKPKAYLDLSDGEDSSTMSADIVAETKYRLKSLEKEAQNLDKVYQDFQYQMTNPVVGPLEPIRSPKRQSQRSEQTDVILDNLAEKVPSPEASPIHRPMSSTPYQQQARASSQHIDDSLHELTAPSSSRDREYPPPRFDLSNMSDEEGDRHTGERIEKPRPITVSDLEARPGSPGIVVVQGSASSGDVIPMEPAVKSDNFLSSPSKKASRLPPLTQEIVETPKPHPRGKLSPLSHDVVDSPIRPPAGGKLAPLSLDLAWKAPSLEDSWKQQEDTQQKQEDDAEIEDWEEQRRKREEERKRREEEAWEREQQELQKLQEGKAASSKEEEEVVEKQEVGQTEGDDGIDPVMKKYMDMIQQQKEKEAEMSKKAVDTWSKGRPSVTDTPTHSEPDLSVADDEQSKIESDGGDFW